MEKVHTIYSDGGVCWSGSPGGSDIGGTWAYCAVDERDNLLFEDSGFIKIEGMQTTNNHTEMVAAVKALEAMERGWSGTLASDSKITLGRLFLGHKNNNLPKEWIDRARAAIYRLGAVTSLHLDGHPTKTQLAMGIGKRGNPVSKWNVYCDKLCDDAKEGHTRITV